MVAWLLGSVMVLIILVCVVTALVYAVPWNSLGNLFGPIFGFWTDFLPAV